MMWRKACGPCGAGDVARATGLLERNSAYANAIWHELTLAIEPQRAADPREIPKPLDTERLTSDNTLRRPWDGS